ncbi:hypothetical protein [Parachryseolinea silvisoli]|nr:hypothetical protein [Parachryseolinea silvisoli]
MVIKIMIRVSAYLRSLDGAAAITAAPFQETILSGWIVLRPYSVC